MQDPKPILIQSARVLDPDGELHAPPTDDLLIKDGCIAARGEAARRIAAGLPRCVTVDAAGMLAVPGFVNAHYHSHDVLHRGLLEQVPFDLWAIHIFPSFYKRRPVAEISTRTRMGAAECIRSGITTVQDMVTVIGDDREHVDAILSAYAESGLRACVALQIGDRPTVDTMPFWREMLPSHMAERYSRALNPSGMQELVTWAMERSKPDRIFWGLAPSTPERCTDELLDWIRATAAERDLRVFTHLYETRAQAVLARLRETDDGSFVRMLERLGLLRQNLTISHGIWIGDEEVRMLADAGVSLVSNPTANLKVLDGIVPLQKYRDVGINIGLGGDNCSCSDTQNMFQAMKAFAIFLSYQDSESGDSAAATAFRAATLGSAKALGMEGQIGTLAVGAKADIALIDMSDSCYHPLHSAVRQLVYAESGRNVRSVLIDGQWVLRDGVLMTLEEKKLYRDGDAAGEALREEFSELAAINREVLPHLRPIHQRVADYPLPFDRFRLF